MRNIELFEKKVRVDDDGYICIKSMWIASGGEAKNKPGNFLRSESTKKYIASLLSVSQIRAENIVYVGNQKEFWIHKRLAYKYASWISPDFEVKTYSVLDRYFSGPLKKECQHELQDYVRRVLKQDDKGSFHGSGLSRHQWEKKKLHDEGETLLDKYQIKIKFKD